MPLLLRVEPPVMHEARSNQRDFSGRARSPPARNEHGADAPPGIPQVHAAQRSAIVLLCFLALIIAFVALVFVPDVASMLSVERGTAVTVAVGWLACTAAAATAYHLTGLSRLYRVLDAVESVSIQAGMCLLVYRSGSAVSIFWLAYLGHSQLIAGVGFSGQNLAVIAGGPTALVLLFWLQGDSASTLLSLLVGAMGAYLYIVMARAHSALEAARAREAQLKDSLARLRVAEERSRIARDLHDGVAGELAALAWRLRQISGGREATTLGLSETEVNHLEGRIRSVLENLRHVVLDLRREQRSRTDSLTALRERCQDLCGNRELAFSVSGALDEPFLERVAEDVQCIVSELVRNAATHADARRVEVGIRIRDGVELSVSDDGIGLPPGYGRRSSGGLANLRVRVARLGGRLEIQSASSGTLVEIRLPASPPNSESPAAPQIQGDSRS